MREICKYIINIPAQKWYVKIVGDVPKEKQRDFKISIFKNDTLPVRRKFERASGFTPLRQPTPQ